jgi:hypothetical protein
MALFPDVIGSSRRLMPSFYGRRTPVGENRTVRFRKMIRPRVGFSLGWDLLSPAEADEIDQHVLDHAGAHVPFDWYDWRPFHWIWVPIGTGTGGAVLYNLGGKDSSEIGFYYGSGTAVGGGIILSSGTGAHGQDQATLTAPDGEPVWINARMRRLFNVTFADDNQPLTRDLDTGYFGFSTQLMTVK